MGITGDDRASRLRSILVGTDFSSTAREAFDWAVTTSRRHGASITLIHAMDTFSIPPNLPPWVSHDLDEHVRSSLARLERDAREAGVTAAGEVASGRPWEVLGDAAQRLGPDLLVIGTVGHGDFSEALLGDTAGHVVRTVATPVVTVHPGDAQRGEMKTVLLATDLSPGACPTTDAVRRLIGPLGDVRVILVHACHRSTLYSLEAFEAEAKRDLEAQVQEARPRLEELAASLAGGNVRTEIAIEAGHPAGVIMEHARAADADLIAAGAHGRSGWRSLIPGGVAGHLLHDAPCPVLTVGEA